MPIRRLLQLSWEESIRPGKGLAPMLTPEHVAEQGRAVRLVDLREPEAITGPVGHVPGSVAVPLERLSEVAAVVHADTPVVLISKDGERARVGALYLQALGLRYVAAMEGGIHAWRRLGFAVRHDDLPLTTPVASLAEEPELPALGEAPSADTIRAHIGAPGGVRWVKMASFMLHGKRSCVDGRDDNGVIGTPGGDTGELLLALGALERLGRPVPDDQVEALLRDYVTTFGRFYMHTDVHTLRHLTADLRADPRFEGSLPPSGDPHAWRRFLASPPEAVRDALLEVLSQPHHIGCGHLKLISTRGVDYHVRPGLTSSFLRAYWTLRWAGLPEMEHVTLGGEHNEGAVLNVLIDEEVWPFTQVPVISPAVGDIQAFVNHPQVSTFLRRQSARWLSSTEVGAGVDIDQLHEAICDLGKEQMGLTLATLAQGLPVFDVRFRRDHSFEVRAAGHAGA